MGNLSNQYFLQFHSSATQLGDDSEQLFANVNRLYCTCDQTEVECALRLLQTAFTVVSLVTGNLREVHFCKSCFAPVLQNLLTTTD